MAKRSLSVILVILLFLSMIVQVLAEEYNSGTQNHVESQSIDRILADLIGEYEWEESETIYSPNYNNTSLHKQNAAISFALNVTHNDSAGNLTMKFISEKNGQTTVLGTIYAVY